MAKVLFDTNIYLRVLHSEAYERQHHDQFARFAPRTYLCSVVAAELYAGAHTGQDIPAVLIMSRTELVEPNMIRKRRPG